MHRVVVAVNQVMNHAGMMGMLRKDFLKHGRSPHISGEVASLFGGAENRERVERGAIDVIGELAMNFCEGCLMAAIAFFHRAVAEENLDTSQIEFLALGRSLGQPGFWRWGKTF